MTTISQVQDALLSAAMGRTVVQRTAFDAWNNGKAKPAGVSADALSTRFIAQYAGLYAAGLIGTIYALANGKLTKCTFLTGAVLPASVVAITTGSKLAAEWLGCDTSNGTDSVTMDYIKPFAQGVGMAILVFSAWQAKGAISLAGLKSLVAPRNILSTGAVALLTTVQAWDPVASVMINRKYDPALVK